MNSTFPPLVTIAIPTFNRAGSFFPLTLASARAQSYPNLEILIADNASTDGTHARVEAIKDERIRYFRHSSNIGPSNNENFCVQETRGDYVVVLPDDDLIDADFVQSCVALAIKRPDAGLVRTGTRVIDEQDRVIRESPNRVNGPSFDDLVIAWIDGKTSPYQCSTMFRTGPLRSIGLHSRHYLFNDVVTHFKIAAAHGRLDIEETKASFRLHPETATNRANIRAWCEESMDVLQLLRELSPKNSEALFTRGMKFLAVGNYRRALRKPFPNDIVAALTVFLAHKFILPPRWVLDEAARRRWPRLTQVASRIK
jgi:glycosyltransferase involved in cell wall biosynthesis